MTADLQACGDSSLFLPLQQAVTRLLGAHRLLAGTEVLEERPGTTITAILRASEGLKRCIIVYPPIVKKYNNNIGNGDLMIEDLEIRIETSEHPVMNDGEINIYALNERVPLVLLTGQVSVAGAIINPLYADSNPVQPVSHEERRIFHHVFHTSCTLTL